MGSMLLLGLAFLAASAVAETLRLTCPAENGITTSVAVGSSSGQKTRIITASGATFAFFQGLLQALQMEEHLG